MTKTEAEAVVTNTAKTTKKTVMTKTVTTRSNNKVSDNKVADSSTGSNAKDSNDNDHDSNDQDRTTKTATEMATFIKHTTIKYWQTEQCIAVIKLGNVKIVLCWHSESGCNSNTEICNSGQKMFPRKRKSSRPTINCLRRECQEESNHIEGLMLRVLQDVLPHCWGGSNSAAVKLLVLVVALRWQP